ncbi:MAG: GNAT family N-acetyltransferase [Flavobacteriaceae bacterium]|nr:GNAT family N-acetyltransferase [Flavobacteriaceae bacterium]
MELIKIKPYKPQYQPEFERLNRTWIEKYFKMEPLDEQILKLPNKYIIDAGGFILFAELNGKIVGTVALKKITSDCYEFTKMGVDFDYLRKGIAEKLSKKAIVKAREKGARNLILFTNSALTPAISLYEKVGFKQVPLVDADYLRADVKMVLNL